MSRNTLKNVGIGLSVLCFVFLFVAVERYQANAASVAAMNRMMQSSFSLNAPFGLNVSISQGQPIHQMRPGVPAITSYAVLFAVLSAAAAATCFVKAKAWRPAV